jgi:hypothetical protein
MRVFKADPQEEGNEPWRVLPLFTLDNSYYLHFLDQNLSGVLERFIKMLREAEGDYYYQVLDDLSCAIPGEVEEAAGGFRQRRMDEYGFPGFEEAFQIYAYISPEQTRGLIEESKRGAPGDRWSPPRYPLSLPDIPRLTSLALERIEGQDVIESIQFDLARLSNKVLVADALDLTKIENIDKSVRKVLGYIETGLEVLAEADPQRAAGLLSEKPLQIIFQAGYSQALRLRFRAMRLMREGWPRQVENPLSLMGEHDGPLIEALLKPRPLYYPEPGEKGETEFREFQSLSEIRRAEAALDRAGIIEPLFMDALGFNPGDMENIRAQTAGRITWESMLCTAFLKTLVSGLFSFHPISSEEIEKFLKEMMTASIPRRIKNDLRTDFINWLARRTENLGQATQAAIQDFARTSLENMEKELERMSPQNLDPRFIQTLFMKIESRVRSSVFS